MRFIGWLFAGVLLILVGWIGGPVAMASYRVAMATERESAREAVANALVEAHARPVKDGFRINLTIVTDYTPVRDCGYDPDKLLYDDKVPFLKSPEWGLDILRRRAMTDFNMIVPEYRAMHLAAHHAVPALAALTECLESPFAPLCRGVVDRMIATADAAQAKKTAELQAFFREQDQAILCTFLDGAAARRGITKTAAATKPAS